ncbi:MAG: penicillin-binding protein beta-lactamase class C [bacterium]|nr:MAG: penicillin-binding protein beta-lactamase class C [bacterium]
MKKINFTIVIFLVYFFTLNIQGFAQDNTSKINEYMQVEINRFHFRGTILISQGDKVSFSKGYGMANEETGTPNDLHTKFRIGSITKQFTAMAIVMLQEKGKLNFQAPISTYLDEYPIAWQDITIHHLLTHTSGIADFTRDPDYKTAMRSTFTVNDLIARFKDKPLTFKPGYTFDYSNSNYILLGHIIEKVSGMPYEQYLQKYIFSPLKMENTGYDHNEKILLHRASGYTLKKDIVINAPFVDMSIPFSTGGLYSTVEDLLVWDKALYTDRLVSKKGLEAMFTPVKMDYGYGWTIDSLNHHKCIRHGGWMIGFNNSIMRFPDEKMTIIVLSNIDSISANTIARDLAAILFGEKYVDEKIAEGFKLNTHTQQTYIGQYEVFPDLIVTICKEDNKLIGKITGYPEIELKPLSEEEFYAKEVDARIFFIKDGEHKVIQMNIQIDDWKKEAKKIK